MYSEGSSCKGCTKKFFPFQNDNKANASVEYRFNLATPS